MRVYAGSRPALCAVEGVGHGLPSPGQHGFDSVVAAVEFWRGEWAQLQRRKEEEEDAGGWGGGGGLVERILPLPAT